jgi:polyketide biosynthesis 3-hydroxy-3-methylglutaryl-CoA synthase-like enzyme PksG
VLALDRAAGYAALEVYDTARPTATFHWVDEVLSLGAYLDLLEAAYAHYRAQVPGSLERDFDHVVYHMPVEMLVRKAHAALLEADDPAATAEAAAASFGRMVAPSLGYCSETGNIFSGTVYAGLAALVDSGPRPGARLGLYSYGSGSCGEFFSGTLQPEARAVVAAHGLRAHLEARRALTIPDYERIVREREAVAGARAWAPDRTLPAGHYAEAYDGRSRLVLDSVADFYRRYAWS